MEVYNLFKPEEIMKCVEFLIDDDKFIEDLQKCPFFVMQKGINKMSRIERLEKIDWSYLIHNGARSYILKFLILKHLTRRLLEEKELFTDLFWQDALNKFYGV